ncbi:MAG: TIGR00282 family metallophosphoesterase [Candidatus Cloacimonetes bacterium]|nr:TIGR00282 family metallophosphoesterase [Candidatus Cloacimonadota bacterium]
MRILFLGDIFGKPGREAIKSFLPNFKKENQVDLCIANCENLSDGKGISEKSINEMLFAGIDIFSSGNHLWDKKESTAFICKEKRIAKPLNYPKASLGFEFVKVEMNGVLVILVTLCGQVFMSPVDSPFYALDHFLKTLHLKGGNSKSLQKITIVDFHAESTAEKRTFGMYFDGRISAMLGTHTHVQTVDEQIMEKGTAYITDVGMCGPHSSVIGITFESSFEKIRTNMPIRHETAKDGLQINAVLIDIDEKSGKALKIKRIKENIL